MYSYVEIMFNKSCCRAYEHYLNGKPHSTNEFHTNALAAINEFEGCVKAYNLRYCAYRHISKRANERVNICTTLSSEADVKI